MQGPSGHWLQNEIPKFTITVPWPFCVLHFYYDVFINPVRWYHNGPWLLAVTSLCTLCPYCDVSVYKFTPMTSVYYACTVTLQCIFLIMMPLCALSLYNDTLWYHLHNTSALSLWYFCCAITSLWSLLKCCDIRMSIIPIQRCHCSFLLYCELILFMIPMPRYYYVLSLYPCSVTSLFFFYYPLYCYLTVFIVSLVGYHCAHYLGFLTSL